MVDNDTTISSWWQNFWMKLHFDKITAYLTGSKERIVEIGLYAGMGFLSGFFLKKFSSLVIMVLVVVGIAFMLQQFNLIAITINWQNMYDLFGIKQPPVIDDNVLVLFWAWIRVNWVISLSYAIGFFVGLNLA